MPVDGSKTGCGAIHASVRLRFVRVGAECDPHGVANARNRPRRRRACRLRLLRAAIARGGTGLQEPSRDARRGRRAGIDRGAVGRRERRPCTACRSRRESIQPVWIEVENHEDRAYYLLSPGLDPNFFPGIRSGRSARRRAARPSSRRARPALSSARVPQSRPSRRDDIGVRADEPRRGRQARADRPGRERARENILDPHDRARLSRRLPGERSVPAGDLFAREDRELHG